MATNWFEQYYKELVDFATRIVLKKRLQCDPCDLVNGAYVKFHSIEEEFDINKVKKYIYAEAFSELDNQYATTGFDECFTKVKKSFNEDRVCCRCNEIMPIGCFRLHKMQGYNIVENTCRKCRSKQALKNLQNNKGKWADYMKKYRRKRGLLKGRKPKKEVHQLWREANLRYIRKQRETLSDVYIRSLLKGKNSNPTSEDIQAKREDLLLKRAAA